MITAKALIEAGRRRLLQDQARLNRTGDERIQAQELLEHAAGETLEDDDPIDARTAQAYEAFLERRVRGEPVPYIRGFEEFRGLRMTVRPGVFIPRQSTEFLAEQGIRRIRRRPSPIAADLACGVGAVAIAMAREVPTATVYGTDISPDALELGRTNAKINRVANVKFLQGSMFAALPAKLKGRVDLVASHPPYIPTHELGDMPAELIEFEPIHTLTDSSSDDGLGLVRILVAESRLWLKPGGWLCIEIAPDMARPVRTMLVRAGYRDVASTRNTPHTRVLVAKR
jgi:release factor glutamine methyltransferase